MSTWESSSSLESNQEWKINTAKIAESMSDGLWQVITKLTSYSSDEELTPEQKKEIIVYCLKDRLSPIVEYFMRKDKTLLQKRNTLSEAMLLLYRTYGYALNNSTQLDESFFKDVETEVQKLKEIPSRVTTLFGYIGFQKELHQLHTPAHISISLLVSEDTQKRVVDLIENKKVRDEEAADVQKRILEKYSISNYQVTALQGKTEIWNGILEWVRKEFLFQHPSEVIQDYLGYLEVFARISAVDVSLPGEIEVARRQWGRLSILNDKISARFRPQNLAKNIEVPSKAPDKRKVSKQKRKIESEDTELKQYLSQKELLNDVLNALNDKKIKLQKDRDFIVQKLWGLTQSEVRTILNNALIGVDFSPDEQQIMLRRLRDEVPSEAEVMSALEWAIEEIVGTAASYRLFRETFANFQHYRQEFIEQKKTFEQLQFMVRNARSKDRLAELDAELTSVYTSINLAIENITVCEKVLESLNAEQILQNLRATCSTKHKIDGDWTETIAIN